MSEEVPFLEIHIVEGKNNRQARKRKEQKYKKVFQDYPWIDIHSPKEIKTRAEGLRYSIGKLQEFFDFIDEDPDVHVPFRVIFGKGAGVLRDITVALCELRGYKETEYTKGIGDALFDRDRNPKEVHSHNYRGGNHYLWFNKDLLTGKDSQFTEDENLAEWLIRHELNVDSGEWSETSDINGTDLELGDLVQVHPGAYSDNPFDTDFPYSLWTVEKDSVEKLPNSGVIHRHIKKSCVSCSATDGIFTVMKLSEDGEAGLMPLGQTYTIPLSTRNLRKLPKDWSE